MCADSVWHHVTFPVYFYILKCVRNWTLLRLSLILVCTESLFSVTSALPEHSNSDRPVWTNSATGQSGLVLSMFSIMTSIKYSSSPGGHFLPPPPSVWPVCCHVSFFTLQTTATRWPVRPAAWSSPTTSSASLSGRGCPTRRVSCTRPSEWPTCCSTSPRWSVPRGTASRRSTRWGGGLD